MEKSLKSTVIQLDHDQSYISFHKLIKQLSYGYQALYVNEQKTNYYYVNVFSKYMLQISNLKTHFQSIYKHFKSLNSKIITPLLQKNEDKEAIYLISQASEYTLGDLVRKRLGLTDFQIVFYLIDMFQIMNYLKGRHCFIEKIELDDLYLSSSMKIMLPFTVFLNIPENHSLLKYLPFRNQRLNGNFCPQLYPENIQKNIDEINSWNLGILIFELGENKKPFKQKPDYIRSNSHEKQLEFKQIKNTDTRDLIKKLLTIDVNQRIKCQLILIHPLLKSYPSIPHFLPQTILSCPPSEIFQKSLNFQDKEELNSKDIQNNQSIKTTLQIAEPQFQTAISAYKTQKYLKKSDRSLSETKVYVQQFVDVSHIYGFGYQLNTGTIGFVFNDETELYFPNSNRKTIIYLNENGCKTTYNIQKLPEEQELKKKLFILEAYIKSIKKYKPQNVGNEKLVTVQQYAKTKNAAVFALSNQNIQVLFVDKICFLITRNTIYFQWKNSDRFEKYESVHDQNPEYKMRKKYTFAIAKKLFNRDMHGYFNDNQENP